MSDLSLVIANKNYSSWSLRPWLFLRHYEIDFQEQRIPLYLENTKSELGNFNSDFKVPILIDNGLEVWDSLAILEYLSETYTQGQGWPQEKKARAIARSVSAEMHSSFANVRNEMPMNCHREPKSIDLSETALREVERIKTLWRQYRTEFGNGGEWLFGDFSIADAMFAPVVIRFNGYAVSLQGIEADYLQSTMNHPAVIEWIEAGKQETEVIHSYEIDA